MVMVVMLIQVFKIGCFFVMPKAPFKSDGEKSPKDSQQHHSFIFPFPPPSSKTTAHPLFHSQIPKQEM